MQYAESVAAAVLRKHGTLSLEEVKVDRPLSHEVRIRTMATGLCHSDLHFIQGRNLHPMPVVMGHEAAGVVEVVGSNVTWVRPGDHVVTFPAGFCGFCRSCRAGRPTLCPNAYNFGRSESDSPRLCLSGGETVHQFANLGTFAEAMLVHENQLVTISREMPFDRAALIGCGVSTGLGAVLRCARVEPGADVAVIGCGGIGLNVVQGAAIAGANRIIAIDHNAEKLDRAIAFGATHLIDITDGDTVERVKKLLRGASGVDHAFEAVGSKATCELAIQLLSRGGTATIIGMLPEGETFEINGLDLVGTEMRVQGTNTGTVRFRDDLPYFIDLYMQGRLKLDELVSQRVPLSEINSGYERIARGDIARTVVVFE